VKARRRGRALRRRYGRAGYGPYGQDRDPGRSHAGHVTDGGEDVRKMTDAHLGVLRQRAWNLSNTHDLRVLEEELVRRGHKRTWG
jgi:hypothetical protein